MQPTLCDNSILVVDRDATPEIGDVVAAQVGDQRTYHRLVRYAPDWDAGPDGLPVCDEGRDLVLRGDNNSDDVDVTHVWHDPHRVDYTDTEDVVGVVSYILDDGCEAKIPIMGLRSGFGSLNNSN
ncbi:S24 family peptidase [Halorubellus sp. JP-L1]|uniref:S24 family peptidase n=1 Tax=Halorubellus sp. JP-L1 TaxID=2715753 RepID=UPI0019630F08|nr:S24 family peptidase [Halorubellus sp. JP-L1]